MQQVPSFSENEKKSDNFVLLLSGDSQKTYSGYVWQIPEERLRREKGLLVQLVEWFMEIGFGWKSDSDRIYNIYSWIIQYSTCTALMVMARRIQIRVHISVRLVEKYNN
jgi:hypothetical protein